MCIRDSVNYNNIWCFFLFCSCKHFSYCKFAKVFSAKYFTKIVKHESFCQIFRVFFWHAKVNARESNLFNSNELISMRDLTSLFNTFKGAYGIRSNSESFGPFHMGNGFLCDYILQSYPYTKHMLSRTSLIYYRITNTYLYSRWIVLFLRNDLFVNNSLRKNQ